ESMCRRGGSSGVVALDDESVQAAGAATRARKTNEPRNERKEAKVSESRGRLVPRSQSHKVPGRSRALHAPAQCAAGEERQILTSKPPSMRVAGRAPSPGYSNAIAPTTEPCRSSDTAESFRPPPGSNSREWSPRSAFGST